MKPGYEDETVTGKTPQQGGRNRQRSAPDVFDQFDVGDQLRAAPAGLQSGGERNPEPVQDDHDDWEQSAGTRATRDRRPAESQSEADDAWDAWENDEPPAEARGRGARGPSQGGRSRPAPEPDEYDTAYDEESYGDDPYGDADDGADDGADDSAPQPARRDPAALVKRYLPYAFIGIIVAFGVAMIGANVLKMISDPPEPQAPRPTLAMAPPAPPLPPPSLPPPMAAPAQTAGGPAPAILNPPMPQPFPGPPPQPAMPPQANGLPPQPVPPPLLTMPLAPAVLVSPDPSAPPAIPPAASNQAAAPFAPTQRPLPPPMPVPAVATDFPAGPAATTEPPPNREMEAASAQLALQANRLATIERQITGLSEATAKTASAPDRLQELRQEVAGLRGSIQATGGELSQIRLILEAERARIDAFDGRMKTMATASATTSTAPEKPATGKPAAASPVRTTVHPAPARAPVRQKTRETAKAKPKAEPQEARRAWAIRAAMPGVVWVRPKNESGGDLLEVRVGQSLPGYGTVVDIRQQNGHWAAITEKGTIE